MTTEKEIEYFRKLQRRSFKWLEDPKNKLPKQITRDQLNTAIASILPLVGFWIKVATKEELRYIYNNLLDIHFYMRREEHEKKNHN